MNRQEAYRILGIDEADSPAEIRRKYHLLMHVHHPDAAGGGTDGSLEMAKKLNEAFAFIKRENDFLEKTTPRDWGIRENPRAYCKRRMYMEDTLFGDEIIVDTGAVGRFYWEPDMEPFSLLLKSLGEAVNHLLESAARRAASDRFSDTGTMEAIGFQCKAKLLHLLIQEYVDACECIALLYPSEETETEAVKVFRLRCHLKLEGRRTGRDYGQMKLSVRAQDSRLFALAGEEVAGQIAFEEDVLYYLVTPLLLQGAAKASLQEKEPGSGGRKRASYLPAEMLLRVDRSRKRDMTAGINREIAATLKRYEECWRR